MRKNKRLIVIEIPYDIGKEQVEDLYNMFVLMCLNLTKYGLPMKTRNIKKFT
jgi:hypothetical protein